MSSIPVVVLGIKRAKFKAEATKKHLKDIGFKNVSVHFGLDIKGKNPEGIKASQVVMYGAKQILNKNRNIKELIYAEDDLRITDPEGLFKHLKNGIRGIERLVYLDIPTKSKYPYGTQMIGFSNRPLNQVADEEVNRSFDNYLNNNYKQNVGKNYGFEFIYDKGETIHKHGTKKQLEKSLDFVNEPRAHKRYK